MPDSGWVENAKLVLKELENHSNRLDAIDNKLGNHITHIEHRLTKIEAYIKNNKYILGLIFAVLLGIFGTVLANFVG